MRLAAITNASIVFTITGIKIICYNNFLIILSQINAVSFEIRIGYSHEAVI